MKSVCFRVDASNSVGMGHLMESMTLAESLHSRKGYDIAGFILPDFPPATNLLERKQFPVIILPEHLSHRKEAEFIAAVLARDEPDVLVCDTLYRDEQYYRNLHRLPPRLVVILDDEVMREISGDIIINFSITQDRGYYHRISGGKSKYFIGPAYIPLADTFSTQSCSQREIPEICRNIFINQGGSDPFGLTARILRALDAMPITQEISVVIGSAVSRDHREELQGLEKTLTHAFVFEWGVSPERMLELYHACDLAITAAGNTLYELAACGIPSIIICHHERHYRVAAQFEERGAGINLGIGPGLKAEDIQTAVARLSGSRQMREQLHRNIRQIVDGKGSQRIVDLISGLC
jgi:UDP-2,4-diacetamido-2,4,6-trideoxy-beta-L-altropyranose hydrolase